MSTSVEFRNLTKRYGQHIYALRDVNLKVEASTFTTLLGPSGSGKTTMLKLLAGFDDPTNGDILIDGRSVVTLPPHRRGIGMVFQNYALFPHMSVAENIAFPLRARNLAEQEIEKRISSVLEITSLEDYRSRYPAELSGGQQQRVALARAIVFDPEVLLMDEPLGALDRHLREQLKTEIKRIQKQLKMTVLFVTHDQDEALVLSDNVVVMRDGRIEQISPPKELYNKPQTRFVASFVGESNLIECQAAKDGVRFGKTKIPAVLNGSRQGPCSVLVRPEHAEITTTRAGSLSGVVRETVYLGESTRYIVDIDGGEFVIKQQNRGQDELTVGSKVGVKWEDGSSVVIFD